MNKLKEKIKSGEKTVGMYVQLADISISRIAGLAGYDFVWVDLEHSYMSYESILAHVIALKSTGTPVVVRAPENDHTAIKKIVEMGVDGIIFPMVKTADMAMSLVDKTLYPPYGERGFGPMGAVDYGLKSVSDYTSGTVDEMCRFIQLEHREAIENLDEIMKNEYIDGYIFGPNDLSGSYSILGQVFSERITGVIRDTVNRLHKEGKYVGIASGGYSEEVLAHWCSFGVEMITAGADFDFIRDGAVNNRKVLERLHKK